MPIDCITWYHKNVGMRIDHLLVKESLKDCVVWAEIDREARKGKPRSDHNQKRG
jgi:exodeoxyribonuclease-3